MTVHTAEFLYQIDIGMHWFRAKHIDGRVYELDTDDLIHWALEWLEGDFDPDKLPDNVNDAYDAMCAGFYSDWQDNLWEPKSSPTR